MNQEKNLHWVQLLRGVAALLVVLTHGRYALLGTPSWPLADQLMTPGAMGVDLFFIISGFIMYYSTTGSPGGAGEAARFLIKRFARVWPVYAVATLVSVYVLSGGTAYFHVAANRLAFWHTLAMLPADPHLAPYFGLTLLVGWTLEFEMYFYLIFAASMLFKRLRWCVLAAWVLLTVILLPLGHAGFDMSVARDHGFTAGYMSIVTSPFVLEFLAGVLIGWAHRQPWLRIRSSQVAWHVLGLSVAFAVFAIYSRAVADHGPTRYGWPLALMVLAMAVASKTVRIRAPALCLWLGSISYSLYLTHPIAQGLELQALQRAGLNSLWSSWWSVLLSTACALSVAALSHHYLEQGLSNKVRNLLLKLVTKRAPAPQASPAAAPIRRRA
jgi:exopolysaccharide production protein ExoZ